MSRSRLASLRGLVLLGSSITSVGAIEFGLTRDGDPRRLVVLSSDNGASSVGAFHGDHGEVDGCRIVVGAANPLNASVLRNLVPWLRPRAWGMATSAGLGDRLGLATPGHVRAMRASRGFIAPVFAQQSIREMERTNRTPQEVMDDALWGVVSEGWHEGFGADADHLKTTHHIDLCRGAEFTFYTLDPGDHVDHAADGSPMEEVRAAYDLLPWPALEDSPGAAMRRYGGSSWELEGEVVVTDEEAVARAAVKYGPAIAHVATMYRHLRAAIGQTAVDVEISVDETKAPTTVQQHLYLAAELQRLGVGWTSLAPRFVGRFEKAIDYIGDPRDFEDDLRSHARVAAAFGGYKLSLHSGSDKFSIYESCARATQGAMHLKTSGTSYLEGLRTTARLAPELFKDLYAFALQSYTKDRDGYHVSAHSEGAPNAALLDDEELSLLLERDDVRQILHVTFGSVLTACHSDGSSRFKDDLVDVLCGGREAYATALDSHLSRHLEPLRRTLAQTA